MLNFNLTLKLVLGYTMLSGLLILCGLAGFYSANKLSSTMDFLLNEAHDTVQGASQTKINVLEQIQDMDRSLSLMTADSHNNLDKGNQRINQSLKQILDVKLVPNNALDKMGKSLAEFKKAQAPLLDTHHKYYENHGKMLLSAKNLEQTLSSFSELANTILVEQQTNWDGAEIEKTNSEDVVDEETEEDAEINQSEEFFAASASTEAKLALFSQLYYYGRIIKRDNIAKTTDNYNNAKADLEIYIDDISSMNLAGKTITKGVGKGKTYLSIFKVNYDNLNKYSKISLDFDKQLETKRESYHAIAQQSLADANNIEQLSNAIIAKEINKISDIKDSAFITIVVVVFIGIFFAVVNYFIAYNIIVLPIKNIGNRLQDISEGEGDLTQTIQVKGNDELAYLANGFNHFTDKIRKMVVKISSVIQQLNTSTGDVTNKSEETKNQMQLQKVETDNVDIAMKDLTKQVGYVSSSAVTAEQTMTNVNISLNDSQEVINETLSSITVFAEDVASATDVILKVQADSQEIGQVLDVIQGIAEQTNLLALNAAIEAARAGEQGRGFAVVADEVRTLASRTHDSTTEIKEIIERLQQGSSNASEVMQKSREQAKNTVESAGSASNSLQDMTRSIDEIREVIKTINTATVAQSNQSEAVSSNLNNILHISNDTATTSQEMNLITIELNTLVMEIQSLVGQFKVN